MPARPPAHLVPYEVLKRTGAERRGVSGKLIGDDVAGHTPLLVCELFETGDLVIATGTLRCCGISAASVNCVATDR